MVLGGRKVAVARPRVRAAGREVPLPTFQTLAREDPLNRRVVEQMLVGVATRQYARSLEPVPAGVVSRGTSKSRACRSLGRKFAHAGSTGTAYRSSTFNLLTNGSNPVGCPAGRRSAVRFAVARKGARALPRRITELKSARERTPNCTGTAMTRTFSVPPADASCR